MELVGIIFTISFSLSCVHFLFKKIYRCVRHNIDYKNMENLIFKEKRKINKKDIEKMTKNEDKCVICFEEYLKNQKIIKLFCNHEYHEICIKKWFKKSINCPLCNLPLLLESGLKFNELFEVEENNNNINNNNE